MEKERYREIDILRGLLIIAVVFGHMEIYADIMYWFHMPAFFILAGVCYKYADISFKDTIKQVLLTYYIPYWGYFCLCRLRDIKEYLGENGAKQLLSEFAHSFYGGNAAADIVAWYITCLILVILIYKMIEKNKYKVLIIFCFYLLARLESYFLYKNNLKFSCVWGADICLYAILFYWIGEHWKQNFILMREMGKRKIGLCWSALVIFCIGLIFLGKVGVCSFGVNMKHQEYNNIFGGVVVPVIFFLMLWLSSILINKVKGLNNVLSVIGKSSFAIMYLHMPMLDVLKRMPVLGDYKSLRFGIVIISSICFTYIVKKNIYLKSLFFGYRKRDKN